MQGRYEKLGRWFETGLIVLAVTAGFVFALSFPAGALALIINGDCGLSRTVAEAKSCNSGMIHVTLIVYAIGALAYPLAMRYALRQNAKSRQQWRDRESDKFDQA